MADGSDDLPGTLGYHPIISLFSSIEYIARLGGLENVELVFDSSRQYDSAFQEIFEAFRDADPGVTNFPNGNQMFYGFEGLKDFRAANSKDEALIQAADLLVTSVYRYAMNVFTGKESDPEIMKVAQLMLHEEGQYPAIPKVVGSEEFANRLLSHVQAT